MTRRLVLATRNAHKVGELREILADVLADLDLQIVGLADFPEVADVVEDGVTFAENALLKARAVAAATGLPALADDSGLAVDVLGVLRAFSRRGGRDGTATIWPTWSCCWPRCPTSGTSTAARASSVRRRSRCRTAGRTSRRASSGDVDPRTPRQQWLRL